MEYSKIIAITGLPGLYELVSSKTDGAIVRSLEDKSTRFVSSRVHSFSHLESIEVFTSKENVNLAEVLQAMTRSTEKLPDDKDAAGLTQYFKKTYPELDFDRVYNSDLRKMVKWFTVLQHNQVDFSTPPPIEVPDEPKDVPVEKPVKAKPAPVKTEPAPKPEKPIKKKEDKKQEAEPKKAEKKPVKTKAAKKETKEKVTKKETPAKKAAKKKK
jgi:Domain of unknown function (DUF5606)